MTRRGFLYGSGCALAAPWSARLGALDEIRVGVVGIRSRGRAHIAGFHRQAGARVVAVCDADRAFLERERKAFADRGEPLATYRDVRELLDADDVDLVAVATPNHWHALMAVWACQAGKDVYLEKPVSHEVWEGRQIVAAARRHERIVATGTQIRSNPGVQEAVAFVRDGGLGAIRRVRGLCYKRRESIGSVEGHRRPPESVDYDLWCGPAPLEPLGRHRLHYDWHWVWSTGNGDLGNQGIHQMDIARWVLGEDRVAPRVYSVGARLGYEDDAETANTQIVVHDYATAPLIFEVRGLPESAGSDRMDRYKGASIGVIVECEEGWLSVPSYAKATAHAADGSVVRRFSGGGDHFANCLKAVRSRRHQDLTADIREGHLSSALCHLGNVSHRLGAPAPLAAIGEHLPGRETLAEPLERLADHLARNGIEEPGLSFGPVLTVDTEKEAVLDHAGAAALLRREYREPFVVPELA